MKNLILTAIEEGQLNLSADIEQGNIEVSSKYFDIVIDFEYSIENLHFEGDGINTPEQVYFDIDANFFNYRFYDNDGEEIKLDFNKTQLELLNAELEDELNEVIKDEGLYE
jgi:hypothetical protein